MATEGPNPRVGVAALIYARDGKFLTGKRMGSHGAGREITETFYEYLSDMIQVPFNSQAVISTTASHFSPAPSAKLSKRQASKSAPSKS